MEDDSGTYLRGGEDALADRVQLCWSPTAQLAREWGEEARWELFEQLLTLQVERSANRGAPLAPGRYYAEVFDDAAEGAHGFLIEIRADRCRVIERVWQEKPRRELLASVALGLGRL